RAMVRDRQVRRAGSARVRLWHAVAGCDMAILIRRNATERREVRERHIMPYRRIVRTVRYVFLSAVAGLSAACGGSDSTAPTNNACAVAPPNGTVTASVN